MEDTLKIGKLYIVATPIGNLEDITVRAIKTLRSVDIIAAEDTRHTLKLLNRYKIKKRLVSCHAHSDAKRIDELVFEIIKGNNIALVSDAGTPLISDPGADLVAACIAAGIRVECLPGPSAVTAAATLSGIDCSKFIFAGFLPRGPSGKRELERLFSCEMAVIIYESPERVIKTLGVIAQIWGGEARVCAARELTKVHEEVVRGSASDVLGELSARSALKGEFTIVIGAADKHAGCQTPDDADAVRVVEKALAQGKSAKDAALEAAAELNISKNVAYKIALKVKSGSL